MHNIMHPLAKALNGMDDVEVDYLTLREIELQPDFDTSFCEYDLVHFGYFMNIDKFKDEIEVPYTCNVHHMHPKHAPTYVAALRVWDPAHIICPEPFVVRQLGSEGVTNVSLIPYAFEHTPYEASALPEEMTVGFLGCDSDAKRFDVIREACKQADVPFIDMDRNTRNEEEGYKEDKEILEFYSNISHYVVASFTDGGPLPPQEALLCGRSVITTQVGMLPQLAARWPELPIDFYDGSVRGLVAELEVQKNMQPLEPTSARELAASKLPSIPFEACKYLKIFKEVIDAAS